MSRNTNTSLTFLCMWAAAMSFSTFTSPSLSNNVNWSLFRWLLWQDEMLLLVQGAQQLPQHDEHHAWVRRRRFWIGKGLQYWKALLWSRLLGSSEEILPGLISPYPAIPQHLWKKAWVAHRRRHIQKIRLPVLCGRDVFPFAGLWEGQKLLYWFKERKAGIKLNLPHRGRRVNKLRKPDVQLGIDKL